MKTALLKVPVFNCKGEFDMSFPKGFSMTFGLIAVDRTTQERKPKESLKYLGSFVK